MKLKLESEQNALYSNNSKKVLRHFLRISSGEINKLLSYFGDVSFQKRQSWKGFFSQSQPKPKSKSKLAYVIMESRQDEQILRRILVIFFVHVHFFHKISSNFISRLFSIFKIKLLQAHFEQFDVYFDKHLFICKMRDALIQKFFPLVSPIAHSFFLSEEMRLKSAAFHSIEVKFSSKVFEKISNFKGNKIG